MTPAESLAAAKAAADTLIERLREAAEVLPVSTIRTSVLDLKDEVAQWASEFGVYTAIAELRLIPPPVLTEPGVLATLNAITALKAQEARGGNAKLCERGEGT